MEKLNKHSERREAERLLLERASSAATFAADCLRNRLQTGSYEKAVTACDWARELLRLLTAWEREIPLSEARQLVITVEQPTTAKPSEKE